MYTVIIFDIMGVLFDKTVLNTAVEFLPLHDGIALVQQLKEQTEVKLYLLSNMSQASFALLQAQYSDVINQFDGYVYSQMTNNKKPHPLVYEFLLNTFELDPVECIMIDDQPINITTAESLGMTGIVYYNAARTKILLQKLHVLV